LKNLLKNAREQKGIKTRELANLLGIDQALISKFESGSRKPTRDQVLKLSQLLDIDYDTIMISWIKEKIQNEYGNNPLFLKSISEILIENNYALPASNEPKIDSILEEMERLKDKLQQLR
jgi:transcriptional regulator with XRE-family HTH domain